MNAVLSTPTNERITLYYREGSSDKVYQAAIEPQGEGFLVNFAYGRRGSTLSTGTKTQTPVEYETATRIFTKLVTEKRAKGYTEGPDGTPYQHTGKEDRVTSLLPQLLNPIEEDAARRLLQDPAWAVQEKFDGRRLLIRKAGAEMHGINRKGLLVGLPEPLFQSFHRIKVDCVLDGESMGDRFQAFDLLNRDGQDLRACAYRERLTALINLLASGQQRAIRFTETAYTGEQKTRLHATLQATGKEGVVFKRLDARYTPGRPHSGGHQLKHKFYATLSAVVAQINQKRSVEVRLLNAQGWQPVGNVTIPANFPIPAIGQVVEIRYLYAFRESNALYQPLYLGPRQDVEAHECVLSQLKYKAREEGEA